jgi:hypothetical protein
LARPCIGFLQEVLAHLPSEPIGDYSPRNLTKHALRATYEQAVLKGQRQIHGATQGIPGGERDVLELAREGRGRAVEQGASALA